MRGVGVAELVDRSSRTAAPAEAVQQVELRGRQRQLAVLVLPVERDEPAAELPQVGRRGRAALDERARAPLGADPPRQHELRRHAAVELRHALAQVRELRLVEQPLRELEGPST